MPTYRGPSGKRLAFPGPNARDWLFSDGGGSALVIGPALAGTGAGGQLAANGAGAITLAVPTVAGNDAAIPVAATGTGTVPVALPNLAGTGIAAGGAATFPLDATALTDATATWHTDTVVRTPAGVIWGYSKSGGRFAVMRLNPASGAVLDSRIILDRPDLYTGINDHFMVAPWLVQNGPFAGRLWALTLPHGVAISGAGATTFFARTSATGLTEDLVVAGSGSLNAGSTHNLGNIQERSDGRLALLTINDGGSPQFARFLFTDNPSVPPVLGRSVFVMTGLPPGGFPQLYTNAVPGLAADTMVVYGYLHPSVPDAPIKRFVVNLSTGQVISNGAAVGTGSVWDTAGAAMLAYGDAPSINAPTGSLFTRVHDVCQYGAFAGGFAVAITQGVTTGGVNAPSHIVRWCPTGSNPDVAANWQQANVGAANRARTWDGFGSSGRRYNKDIRFLPPRGAEAIRMILIAYDGTLGERVEVWAGAAPNTMAMVFATEWQSDVVYTRLFVNPGAAADQLLGIATSYTGAYNGFDDFTPGPLLMVLSNPSPAPAVGTGVAPLQGLEVAGTGNGLIAFQFTDLGPTIELNPAFGITESGGNISAWAATTANGGTASTFSQGTGANQPDRVAGPPVRLDFVAANTDNLIGDATALGWLGNRSAWMIILRVEADATSTQDRVIVNFSVGGSSTQARAAIRHSSTNTFRSTARRLDADSASSTTGPVVTAGQKYLLAQVVNFDAGGSSHSLWVDGVEYTALDTGGSNPTAGARSTNGNSQTARLGTSSGSGPTVCFEGKIGAAVIIQKTSGNFTPAEVADALAKYQSEYPAW